MYNKNVIYIPERGAQGQKSYVGGHVGGLGGRAGSINAGVLSEPLLR